MRRFGHRLALLLLCAGPLRAQEVEQVSSRRPPCPDVCAPSPGQDTPTPIGDAAAAPSSGGFREALASAGESGTQPGASYAPAFFGDLLGTTGTKPALAINGKPRLAFAPINRHAGAIKITDNESPQPTDRVFWFYNEFTYVNFSSNTDLTPINLQRHIFGFEKTLLGGWASVGLRVPIVMTDGPPELATRQFADMTIITKVALWDDRRRGYLISAGLAVTVPTGETEVVTSPTSGNTHVIDDVILQPYAGYIYSFGPRLFAQGFTALAVPTDSRDVTLLFNDVALGYWLLRASSDAIVRGVVPTWEFHISTPLNRRGKESAPLGFSDVVNMTWGVHAVLTRATVGGAVGVPLTGPKPYGVEAVARCELRF